MTDKPEPAWRKVLVVVVWVVFLVLTLAPIVAEFVGAYR